MGTPSFKSNRLYWSVYLLTVALYLTTPNVKKTVETITITDNHFRNLLCNRDIDWMNILPSYPQMYPYDSMNIRKCSQLENHASIITDRVRSTRREVIVSLCLSVHTYRGRGGTKSGPAGGGYPSQVQAGGRYSSQVQPGVPKPGPAGGTPCQTWPREGTHAGVTPARGYPTSGTPCQTRQGGYPCWGGTPPRVSGLVRPGWRVPYLRYPP